MRSLCSLVFLGLSAAGFFVYKLCIVDEFCPDSYFPLVVGGR